MKLHGLTPATIKVKTDIHNDILDWCKAALLRDGIVIYEEALYRTKNRQHRDMIQWAVLQVELQEHFNKRLLGITRSEVRTLYREQRAGSGDPNWKPPVRLLAELEDHIKKGNGSLKAGFYFPEWSRAKAEKQIDIRRHIGDGFHNSAGKLETELDAPVALPPADATELGNDGH